MLGIVEIDKLLFSTVLGKSQPVSCVAEETKLKYLKVQSILYLWTKHVIPMCTTNTK